MRAALDRMAREVAAIERIDRDAAIAMLNKSLVKTAPPSRPDRLPAFATRRPASRRAFSFEVWRLAALPTAVRRPRSSAG